MMITQRPQDIAKAMLTQIGTLVAHRLTAPQDRKAIEEWVKGHADEGEAKQVLQSLASLGTGEAWAWSPDHGLLVRAKMPPIQSFDSGATPDADTGTIEQPPLTAIDLGAIRGTLEAKGEVKAKNDLPATHISDEKLKSRIAELEAERDHWKSEVDRLHGVIAAYQRGVEAQMSILADISWPSVPRKDGSTPHEPLVVPPVVPSPMVPPALAANTGGSHEVARDEESRPEGRAGDTNRPFLSAANGQLPPRHHRILDAIAWGQRLLKRNSVERNIVAWIAEISPKSSSYANDLGALRTKGLIEYPGQGTLALTDAGSELANWPAQTPTRQDLLDAIKERLEPRHRRILDVLWQQGEQSRLHLANYAAMSPTSSSFANDLGKLRTLGLIDYPQQGMVGLGRVLQ